MTREAFTLNAQPFQEAIDQLRERLGALADALPNLAANLRVSLPTTPQCCCGNPKDRHWDHTPEECTWVK